MGVLLAVYCDNNPAIVLLVRWQLVYRCSLDPGPLTPEVDACGRLDQVHYIGTTYASSRFEEVKTALIAPFNEFHVDCPLHHPKRAENSPVQFLQGLLILGATENRARGGDSALVKYIQWRADIMVGFRKKDLAGNDQ